MEQALKPCPFCGNRMELWPGADAVRHAEPIGKCPIAANAFTDIPAWNRRASAEAQGNVAMEPVAWMYEYDGRILDIVRGEDALAIRRQAFPYATFTALVPASSIASLSERLAEAENDRDRFIEGKVLAEHQRDELQKRVEALSAEVGTARAAAFEEAAREADRLAEMARGMLARAKKRSHQAGLLLAAGYQGDPDAELAEVEIALSTAEDIAAAIRSRAALDKGDGE